MLIASTEGESHEGRDSRSKDRKLVVQTHPGDSERNGGGKTWFNTAVL